VLPAERTIHQILTWTLSPDNDFVRLSLTTGIRALYVYISIQAGSHLMKLTWKRWKTSVASHPPGYRVTQDAPERLRMRVEGRFCLWRIMTQSHQTRICIHNVRLYDDDDDNSTTTGRQAQWSIQLRLEQSSMSKLYTHWAVFTVCRSILRMRRSANFAVQLQYSEVAILYRTSHRTQLLCNEKKLPRCLFLSGYSTQLSREACEELRERRNERMINCINDV
jgi:hypothetical protein